MSETRDLLFEIGCEELPSSYVARALKALPELVTGALKELRLDHGTVSPLGTPRRLAVHVADVQTRQGDLEEEVTGPPVKAAFRDGEPTKAATAFAAKLGCDVGDLRRVETPKGEYLQGTLREQGKPAAELLGPVLAELTAKIPFRKSMRWGDGDFAFGRPIRWLVALFGDDVLPLSVAGIAAGRASLGHRFLHPEAVTIDAPSGYVSALRSAHVLVDAQARRTLMIERLHAAAAEAGGKLIEDDFLVGENLSLVEDPQVVIGGFDEDFLELPDAVILEVARGHQRYFGMRDEKGSLMPRYLAVVNTAESPQNIRQGNDRVMRARLADARFFYREDMKRPLADRFAELSGIVFQNRLGSVGDKVERIEALVSALGEQLGVDAATIATARAGARLAKCDLVTWMVGELPELQGEMGRAYALAQGVEPAVADVIRDHYLPKSAKDALPPTTAAALVSLADRIDTLTGCFAIGLTPTGAADPYGLRRACIATLRIILDRGLDLSLPAAFAAAYRGFGGVELDVKAADLAAQLAKYFRDRLRGLLSEELPVDVVDAALGAAAQRPLDVRARAQALAALDGDVRGRLGEVFKRASNIAAKASEDAKGGDWGVLSTAGEDAELALIQKYMAVRQSVESKAQAADYAGAFEELAGLAPILASYFDQVLIMADDDELRANRLSLMRAISRSCRSVAHLDVLGGVS